jgi:hypothetical protein
VIYGCAAVAWRNVLIMFLISCVVFPSSDSFLYVPFPFSVFLPVVKSKMLTKIRSLRFFGNAVFLFSVFSLATVVLHSPPPLFVALHCDNLVLKSNWLTKKNYFRGVFATYARILVVSASSCFLVSRCGKG